MASQSKDSKSDSNSVTREEFNEVRDAVVGLEKTVASLADSTQAQTNSMSELRDTIETLARGFARESGSKGTVQLNNVWHALGAGAVFAGIISALIMFAINSDIGPLQNDINRVQEQVHTNLERFKEHEQIEGHPLMAARVTALEKEVKANHLENETQHRWLGDVIKTSMDWQYRTRNMENLPPPNHQPLEGVGTSNIRE